MYNGESLAIGALSRGVVYITISSAAASVAKQVYLIFTASIKCVDLHVNTYHETGAWFFAGFRKMYACFRVLVLYCMRRSCGGTRWKSVLFFIIIG